MKNNFFCRHVTVLIIFLSILAPALSHAIEANVTKVADGDTVTAVTKDNQILKIRLFGIDAPEKKQPFGQKAKQVLTEMVHKKDIDVDIVTGDRYGRSVGIIRLGNKTLNEEMIKRGLAWVYHDYCNKPECEKWTAIEEKARKDRKGLWEQPSPQAPWDFRRAEKNRNKEKNKKSEKEEPDFMDILGSGLKKMFK